MAVTLKLKEEVHFVCITPTFENSDLKKFPPIFVSSCNQKVIMLHS